MPDLRTEAIRRGGLMPRYPNIKVGEYYDYFDAEGNKQYGKVTEVYGGGKYVKIGGRSLQVGDSTPDPHILIDGKGPVRVDADLSQTEWLKDVARHKTMTANELVKLIDKWGERGAYFTSILIEKTREEWLARRASKADTSTEIDCALDSMAEQINSLGANVAGLVKRMDLRGDAENYYGYKIVPQDGSYRVTVNSKLVEKGFPTAKAARDFIDKKREDYGKERGDAEPKAVHKGNFRWEVLLDGYYINIPKADTAAEAIELAKDGKGSVIAKASARGDSEGTAKRLAKELWTDFPTRSHDAHLADMVEEYPGMSRAVLSQILQEARQANGRRDAEKTYDNGTNQKPPTYNAEAVNKEISKDKRIKGKEASAIHRLLKGRHDGTAARSDGRKYYTLVIDGKIHFGDYDRNTVKQEMDDESISSGIPKNRMKIVQSGDTQAEIDKAVRGDSLETDYYDLGFEDAVASKAKNQTILGDPKVMQKFKDLYQSGYKDGKSETRGDDDGLAEARAIVAANLARLDAEMRADAWEEYRTRVRIKSGGGMKEFAGKTGTVQSKEGNMWRVKLDEPVEIPGVGKVKDDLWESNMLTKIN